MRTALLTAAALVGFAANSLLCRMALRPRLVDAATFTAIRIVSGAVALFLIARAAGPHDPPSSAAGSWGSAAALVAYAAAFSFAYLRIDAGIGALLLFGAVQVTMLGWALFRGERPGGTEWAGLLAALAGLVALVRPGLTAPDPLGAALMLAAGVAWGAYSLRGRRAGAPLLETAANFARAAPLALALELAAPGPTSLSLRGALLATASGALTSGVGYSLWYAALRGLTATRAAIVQLSVPVLAAAGGVAVLGERPTPRLLGCAAVVLGGVALAIAGRSSARPQTPPGRC